MTTRKVLSVPDPLLREISDPVTEFGDSLKTLVQDMVDTLEVMGGAGLASPQIGVLKRVLAIKPKLFADESPDSSYSPDTWVLINPVVRPTGEKQRWSEACLSVPLGMGSVERHEACEVKYQRLDGTEHTVTVQWPLAGAVQHENDHLNGVLYVDHVGNLERSMILRKVEKMHHKVAQLAEARKEQEILDLKGPKALLKYRAERNGQQLPEKTREKKPKRFGRAKKRK